MKRKNLILLVSVVFVLLLLIAGVSIITSGSSQNVATKTDKSYVVTFFDKDGNVLNEQTVEHGLAAEAPEAPELEGYEFVGWDTEYENVTQDLDVTTLYQPIAAVASIQSLAIGNTIHLYVYIGPQYDNLIQEIIITDLTAEQIDYLSTLQSTALAQALQPLTPVPIGGLIDLIQNSEVYRNGQIQVEEVDAENGIYKVEIHIKESATVDYTVEYVDTNGADVAPPKTASGYVGQLVTESAISVAHYTLVSASPQQITLDTDAANNVITFVYQIDSYLIDTTVTGGTINPVDPYVEYGSDQMITYSPNTGFYLVSVTVDGSPVSIATYPDSYTFSSVAESHTITVVYEQETVSGITVTGYSGVYDAQSHSVSVTGTLQGDVVKYSLDGVTYTTEQPFFTNVTNATVYVKVERTNYLPYFGSANVTITPAPLTVTAEDKTITYGDLSPSFTATYSGFVGTENESVLGGTLSFTCAYSQGDPVGTYAITPSGLTSSNYSITYVDGTLTVEKKDATITADNASKNYGNPDPVFTATVSGTYGSDVLDYTLSRTPGEAIGTYDITVTLGSNDNYNITTTNGTFTITQKALTVTADDITISYGDPIPTYTVSYAGFAPGEDENDLGGALVLTCSYAQGDGVGTYDIVPSGLTSENYNITFVNGTLTVEAIEATITANDLSKVYGDSDPTLTATVTGAYNGDVLDYTVTRTAGEDVGAYNITVTEGSNPNYNVTVVDGTFTITPAPLTVTSEDKTITYGDPSPSFTATYSGFVGTEDESVLGGTLSFTCAYLQGDPVGTYKITPSGVASSNYSITYVDGTLTVEQKDATITANDASKEYGDPDPIFAASVSGTYGSDMLNYSLSRTPGETAGTYDIIVTLGSNDNYNITTTNGTFTITPKALTVSANNLTISYGDPIPTYTVSYTGFAPGEDENDLGGVLVLTCSYAQGDGVGTYDIVPSGLTSENYNITFVNGTLTVEAIEATITANDLSKVYGDSDPTLTATVTGAYNGDVLDYTVTRTAGEDVDAYDITVTAGANPNYQVTVVGGTFSITPKPLALNVDDLSKVYGSNDPALTATLNGLVSGDTLDYTLQRDAGEDVGTYVITATLGNNPNYTIIDVTSGIFTITPKAVRITELSDSKVYGSDDPNLAVAISGLVSGDTLQYSVTRTAGEDVGTYAIISSVQNDPNYNITIIGGTFTITPKVLTVTAASYTINQGDTPPDFEVFYAGFAYDDDETVLDGTLIVTSEYTLESEAGDYAIVPSGLSSDNYTIRYVNGALTVLEVIPEEEPPLAEETAWALLNLLLMILTILISLILLINYFRKKDEDEEVKRKGVWRILSILPAIAAVILFFLTEDMTAPMQWIDKWTIWMAIITVVEIVIMLLARRRSEENEEPEEPETPQEA